jgi:hypothetical protein
MDTATEMLRLLESVAMPQAFGFLADLAHTSFYLADAARPRPGSRGDCDRDRDFHRDYDRLVADLGPWTVDLHIAQTDGRLYGCGDHAPTGRHCLPDDPAGCLDVVACACRWLAARGGRMTHVCWDGCMFPNAVLEDPATWTGILRVMIAVRDRCAANAGTGAA